MVAVVGEDAADDRTEDEAEAEGGTDHPHAPRPLGVRRGVSDESLRHGDVGARHAGQHARCEEQAEPVGQPEEQIREGRAGQADQDHRPTPDAVRPTPPQRSEEQLHGRIDRHQQTDRHTGGMELAGVIRQERQDDAEPD
jgi:hypothetical protein